MYTVFIHTQKTDGRREEDDERITGERHKGEDKSKPLCETEQEIDNGV